MVKWGLSQGYKDFSVTNQSVWYTRTKWKMKSIWQSQQMYQKLLKKIQHPFMIKKKTQENGHGWNIPANIILNGLKSEITLSKIRNKTRMSTVITFI